MRELPRRKRRRLIGYDYSRNGAYFITICVKDKHEMLGNIHVGRDAHIAPQKPEIILSEYGVIVKKYIENINIVYDNVVVDNFVIMPNHIHMIIVLDSAKTDGNEDATNTTMVIIGAMRASRPTGMCIPSIIKSLKIMTTKECGFSFWQTSYHDHVIQNETEYRKIYDYIENNPINWQKDCFYMRGK